MTKAKKFNHLALNAIIAGSGKSQNDIAEALGVHINTVSNWVNGHATPSPFALAKCLREAGWDNDMIDYQKIGYWYVLNGASND